MWYLVAAKSVAFAAPIVDNATISGMIMTPTDPIVFLANGYKAIA
jgi:hypothetical protein